MFAENGSSILMPYLLGLVKGDLNNVEGTLSETTFAFLSKTGISSSVNASTIHPDSVAVLNIHHPIFKYDQSCGPKGTQTIMSILEDWKTEDNIKGVILDFNSGGGQVSGTPELAEYVSNYSKPIVSYTNDVVGSAAYYIASGADYFIANKHADYIGSIGVMMHSVNMEGVLLKAGATINELYSELSPDKNKASRDLKEGNSKTIIKEFLNPLATDFHTDTKKYRPSISEKALKGGVFRPKEALSEGLIDEIGTMQTAIDKVFELSAKNFQPKKTKMSYKKIEAAIGAEFEASEIKDGILLSENQAKKVDETLAALEISAKTETDKAEALGSQLADLNTVNTTIVEEVNTSLKLEGDAKVTDVKGAIEALNTEISNLNAGPGDVHTTGKKIEEENHGMPEYVNTSSSIYNPKS